MFISQIAATLTIPNGTASSNVIGVETLSDAESFILQAPATLAETVTISVSSDGVTFAQLMDSAGVAVKVPVVATAISYHNTALGPAQFLKLVSGGNVAADRSFVLMKQSLIGG